MLLRAIVLLAGLLSPIAAQAIIIGIPGEDGGGLSADVSVAFGGDIGNAACLTATALSPCTLTVTLSYNGVDGDLTKRGQVLTGVIFEPLLEDASGNALQSKDAFDLDNPGLVPSGSAEADSLVGNNAGVARQDLSVGGAPDYLPPYDLSPHWAVNPQLNFGVQNGLGSVLATSVGDITFEGATWDQDVSGTIEEDEKTATGAGTQQLLAGGPSSVEDNPPNGADFGIVPSGVCTDSSCPDPLGNDPNDNLSAFVEGSIVLDIHFAGALLTAVDPDSAYFLFGTDGNVAVPEPQTLVLMFAGLLGLGLYGRRSA